MGARACGVPAARLSAFVDGALGHRERDRLAVHALNCSACREELNELRRTRNLLQAGSPCAAPADRLAARLLAIPTEHRPGPSRRTRRLRTVLVVALVGILTVGGTTSAVGWAAAPAPGAEIQDPGIHGEDAFVSVEASRPLGSYVVAAMMSLDDAALVAPPAALAPRPVLPGSSLDAAGIERTVTAVTNATGRVALDGQQSVRVRHGERLLAANAGVRTRGGQGTQVTIQTIGGQVLSETFTPSPTADQNRSGLSNLADGKLLTGRTGQRIAGRSAVLLELSGAGGLEGRWWVDAESGVQLWRELWSAGVPRESVGFTQVRIGATDDFFPHLQPQLAAPMTTSALSLAGAGGLNDQGWACCRPLAGLPMVGVRRDERSDVLHTVYGGAARTVTVVQTRGTLADQPTGFAPAASGVWIRDGWPAQTTWQSGGTVFTVTADSMDQAAAVTADLPHLPPSGRAPWDRVRAGWMRVGDIVFG
ncbi:MAG: zf-HC2 domain-containing protein [Propionibacteriales bacterium]|nr:zf-HC2 domain-containing protein [Propionibacteriales bacterium]